MENARPVTKFVRPGSKTPLKHYTSGEHSSQTEAFRFQFAMCPFVFLFGCIIDTLWTPNAIRGSVAVVPLESLALFKLSL
jgi:hypothetical protein